jgi:2-amino-4-hydroxy-6-hydroxymethyldihydropteridine diphosphokinase
MSDRSAWQYLIALGGNIPHPDHGSPSRVLKAALARLDEGPLSCIARSRIIGSAPLGPSRRQYANAAAIVETALNPPDLLNLLQTVERDFGRRRTGQRWGARRLDLDIVLWSGGAWSSADLTIPHPEFRKRDFVLKPARAIAPGWRDPVSNRTVAQLAARVLKQAG